nr:MAG TPA: hypothetical protein [Caudoviricetes sp.]
MACIELKASLLNLQTFIFHSPYFFITTIYAPYLSMLPIFSK